MPIKEEIKLNPSSNFADSIIRIQDNNGSAVGCGFYLHDRYFVTCAHVVTSALYGHKNQELIKERPEDDILCNFSGPDNEGILEAIVLRWSPHCDLALLVFTSPISKVKHRKETNLALKQGEVWDHPIRSFGYPPMTSPEGIWATGILRGYTERRKIQVDWNQSGGYPISQGFSGSPVFDNIQNCVVGIVETIDETHSTAFVIPLETIFHEYIEVLTTLTQRNPEKVTMPKDFSKRVLNAIKTISIPLTMAGLIHYLDNAEIDLFETTDLFFGGHDSFEEGIVTEIDVDSSITENSHTEPILIDDGVDGHIGDWHSSEGHGSEHHDYDYHDDINDSFLDTL